MSRTTISERGEIPAPEEQRRTDTTGGNRFRRALSGVGLLVAVGSGALLAVGAFLGLYVRPTSDDWCALWKARDMGPLGITADFYNTQNGRVTNAFLTGLLYSDDMTGPKLLPAFLVVALGVVLFFLARATLRALGRPQPPAVLLVAAVGLLEALLFFAGTRSYQVLLWAPATISHTLPSVIGLWAVLWAVLAARSPRPRARKAAVVGVVLVGLAIGMLSEPFTIVAGLFAAVVGLVCLPRLRLAKDWYVTTWCAAACVGLGTGLLILYTSPGAQWRRAQNTKKPMTLAELGETFHDWWRIWQTIIDQWAYVGALTVGLLLGLGLAFVSPSGDRDASAGESRPRRVPLVLAILPVPLLALASLGVAYGLRSGYGPTGWTYGRTWTNFVVPLLLILCAYGAWAGYRLGRRLQAPGRPVVRAVVLAAVGALTVGSVMALVEPVYSMTRITVARSIAMDRQNAKIRAEVKAGDRDVAYQPILIGGLAEPLFARSYKRDWAAQCTSKYYGVERIHRPGPKRP
ncbi:MULTISPECIES: DUF6056 family protein [Streptomyces]|uniref:Integral membrane protein n=1 Tax=Streptomyces venezuelae (strain ATCC 10712 / CBS 650.69 / DSM 40230 / JCM 4526 / NBRC 13096 / PD 04745) TaxID=953739 RepID=F2R2A9_STRVP|nr:DUF6056 family protein [Streptomyces venezuelae]APE21606.1 hypothetical protein vnz_11610 [Streptomyces venezuelae]QER98989.1 hypothetical protein DEJ43_11755 [Streptomyces venezuelae ATCC 10712]QES15177.1 hypothetical protein DEJ45_24180 [Streptomyces venezuelae]CCA55658.1 integral membrane protein [Streptomyces venezuelae ATCC 10712]